MPSFGDGSATGTPHRCYLCANRSLSHRKCDHRAFPAASRDGSGVAPRPESLGAVRTQVWGGALGVQLGEGPGIGNRGYRLRSNADARPGMTFPSPSESIVSQRPWPSSQQKWRHIFTTSFSPSRYGVLAGLPSLRRSICLRSQSTPRIFLHRPVRRQPQGNRQIVAPFPAHGEDPLVVLLPGSSFAPPSRSPASSPPRPSRLGSASRRRLFCLDHTLDRSPSSRRPGRCPARA